MFFKKSYSKDRLEELSHVRGLTLNFKTIIDISPVISPRLAVFPGDEPYRRQISMDLHEGDNLTLSSMASTLHIGAHVDAPSHYSKNGESIDQRKLEIYLGPCQVIRLEGLKSEQRIFPDKLGDRKILAPRVLFYTGSYEEEKWTDDFNSLSPELIEFLHNQGVILVGIDTPSVDPASSKGLESHARICHFDMAVLEGIVLKDCPEGLYTLVALPLRLENADASPVRAVLLS
jgi:arylformamidase